MKVFKIYALLIVFSCIATAITAQDKFDRLYRLPPDFSMAGHSVQQLEDGSYIMLSAIDTIDPADINYTAARLTSFSDKGNENWSVDYIFEDTLSIQPIGNVVPASEGGFLFSTSFMNENDSEFAVVKVDGGGTIEWSKSFGSGISNNLIPGRNSLTKLMDSLTTMVYVPIDSNTDVPTSFDITGLDEQSGSIRWSTSIESEGLTFLPDLFNTSTSLDSNLLLVGNTVDGSIVINELNNLDGQTLWSRMYNLDSLETATRITALDIAGHQDSVMVICGILSEGGSSHSFVSKLNSEGNVLWSQFMNFNDTLETRGMSVDILENGNIAVFLSSARDQASTETVAIQVMLDAQGGIVYSKQYPISKNNRSLISELDMTTDGGAITVSTTLDDTGDAFYSRLMKTNTLGETFCEEDISIQLDTLRLRSDTLIWTNNAIDVEDTIMVIDTSVTRFTTPILTLRDTTFCPGDPVEFLLDATTEGATDYQWYDAEEPDNILGTDSTFLATEVDVNYVARVFVEEDLCYILCDTSTLSDIDPPMVMLQPGFGQWCDERLILVAAQVMGQAQTIEWSNGETDVAGILVDQLGSYSVTVTNTCGDTGSASVSIGESDLPPADILNLAKSTDDLCTDGVITLSATTPGISEFLWSTGETTPTIQVSETGTYSLKVIDDCQYEIENSIEVNDDDFIIPLDQEISKETDNCSGGQVPLTVSGDGNVRSILWSNNQQTASILVNSAGTYSVTVTDICGDTQELETDVSNEDINGCGRVADVCLEFPNAFIPDSDIDENASFGPVENCSVSDYNLKIFNRWGQKVFESNALADEWNGMKGNREYPGDVYVWVVEYSTNEDSFKDKGDVTLIR